MTVAIVLPFYNEEEGATQFLESLTKSLAETKFAKSPIVIVDDGSTDNTFNEIKNYVTNLEGITLIKFYTNYGHETAVRVGISKALELPNIIGVAVMDSDFQDPIATLIELLYIFDSSKLAVFGRSKERIDSFQKKLLAKIYYMIQGYLYGNTNFAQVRNFFVIPTEIARSLVTGKTEYQSVRSNLIELVKTNARFHDFSRESRGYGQSKYPLGASLALAINGFLAHPKKINLWIARSAMLNLSFSIFLGSYILWARALYPATQNTGLPFALLLLTLILFLISMGFWLVIALTLRIFNYVRGLPAYVVMDIK